MPAVVRWPGEDPRGEGLATTIVSMIDVFPTFLAAAGGEPRAQWKIDGTNLLDALARQGQSARAARCSGNGARAATRNWPRCAAT